jgi:hypothetical protein
MKLIRTPFPLVRAASSSNELVLLRPDFWLRMNGWTSNLDRIKATAFVFTHLGKSNQISLYLAPLCSSLRPQPHPGRLCSLHILCPSSFFGVFSVFTYSMPFVRYVRLLLSPISMSHDRFPLPFFCWWQVVAAATNSTHFHGRMSCLHCTASSAATNNQCSGA